MKTLRKFLSEEMTQFSGFLISRDNMPQIKFLKDFVNFVDRQGIDVVEKSDFVDHYRPTQINYEQEKVDRIKLDISKTLTAIVVSEDGFVLDGHHRYFAAKQMNVKIPIVIVNLPINKLLKLTQDYLEFIDD